LWPNIAKFGALAMSRRPVIVKNTLRGPKNVLDMVDFYWKWVSDIEIGQNRPKTHMWH